MITSALLPFFAAALGPADAPLNAEAFSPAPAIQEADESGWNGSVTAGATLTTGNNETKSASLSAEANWQEDADRFSIGAFWNYQSDDTSGVVQRRVYALGQYDHFLNDKTYSFVNGSGEHNFASDLDMRYTVGVGLGHEFRNDDKWLINGEAGVSYIDEDFGPTAADPTGNAGDNEYIAARLAYDMAYLAGENWEFAHGGQIFPSLEDADDVYARWDTRVKANLTETMFAQIQWIWDYDNTPAPGADRNDSLFALTIGWTF